MIDKIDVQFIVGVTTIIGSMYGMLKFMLKDTHKEVKLLEIQQQEFKYEMRIMNERMDRKFDAAQKKFDAMDNRLDGLYRVILDRTYGKNIPDDLK